MQIEVVYKKSRGAQKVSIKFPYDPMIVEVMRKGYSRKWNSETKTWEMLEQDFIPLLPLLKNYDIVLRDFQLKEEKAMPVKKDVEIPANFTFKTDPFNHQKEGLYYGLQNDKFLLGDEQGLGKTKQIIDLAVCKKLLYGYKHCLIICGVNGLKWNWQEEIKTHSNEGSFVLGSRVRKRSGKLFAGGTKEKLEDLMNLPSCYFLITNVESLRCEPILKQLKKLCANNIIQMIAFDEIHKCKNPSTSQGRALLDLDCETKIGMTGTPLMNSPLDLYTPLKWLGYENHAYNSFKQHFCVLGGYGGYEVVGYKNLEDLHDQLSTAMLRRLKKDVLDLPEKLYTKDYVEMYSSQVSLYEEIRNQILEDIDKVKVSDNPLACLIRLRQVTGCPSIVSSVSQDCAKLDRLEDLVEELSQSGSKCLVFSNWEEVIAEATRRLSKYKPLVITGKTKDSDRPSIVQKFQTDEKRCVLLGTIGAMGTGLTLTAASTIIFLDQPWNKANQEQAEDRAHRIGTTGTLNIINLVTKDTIDEKIYDLVESKGLMAEALVNIKEKESSLDLLRKLLA